MLFGFREWRKPTVSNQGAEMAFSTLRRTWAAGGFQTRRYDGILEAQPTAAPSVTFDPEGGAVWLIFRFRRMGLAGT